MKNQISSIMHGVSIASLPFASALTGSLETIKHQAESDALCIESLRVKNDCCKENGSCTEKDKSNGDQNIARESQK